ncbi:MAG: hypothetical protein M3426_16065 [Actinomycetota bacterium]|nr:hypothetical protein [Actinomycetota bacterium]
MRRIAFLPVTVLLAAVLFASGIGTVAAEPQKNQIEVPVTCSNGEQYTLVFNAMSKTGQVLGNTSNIVIKSGTVTYFNLVTGEKIESDEVGGQGKKKDLRGELITCSGTVTTELVGLGKVRAVFEFQGFVTPRGG